MKLVSWVDLPLAPPARGTEARSTPRIDADEGGLWIQNHPDGPLARVTVDGISHAEYVHGDGLIAAGHGGAYCHTAKKRPNDIASSPDVPPRPRKRRQSSLTFVLPGGGTENVPVEGFVFGIGVIERVIIVKVEHEPWVRVPIDGDSSPVRFRLTWQTTTLHVPLDEPRPERISRTEHEATEHLGDTGSEYADLTYNEKHYRKRASGGEWRWHWGLDKPFGTTTVIRGYRANVVERTIEWPGVRLIDGTVADDRLWSVTTAFDPETRVAVDGIQIVDTDGVVSAVPIGGVDITDHCRPVGPRPLDHDSYVAFCVRRIDRMIRAGKATGFRASYVGDWPSGQLHIAFEHDDYPGLTLVARRNLYDEFGVRLDDVTDYIAVELLEQAGTRAYPAADRAVDGILWV
ncbi:hypothetical protein [Rhodococcus sp. NBC_00297]|uniref:hypothetical protein n=1 Tax=Rhodococcus sp. NBC_00297 TaxID=2976005 RepID=UPI002E2D98A7|nr:hypothetical protein [Rhodococcus sp. NBC_00297]